MKFYFCEGCGKRITDADIDKGHGKDKKLKGVYCTGCAQGIFTMETLPLSEEDAEALLRGTPSSSSARDKSETAGSRPHPSASNGHGSCGTPVANSSAAAAPGARAPQARRDPATPKSNSTRWPETPTHP